ncbi:hypothetical protein BTH41_04920 [Bacillus mycoides]|nr:hypothetical protein BTH41_04920 [Bacillus mycoides]
MDMVVTKMHGGLVDVIINGYLLLRIELGELVVLYVMKLMVEK